MANTFHKMQQQTSILSNMTDLKTCTGYSLVEFKSCLLSSEKFLKINLKDTFYKFYIQYPCTNVHGIPSKKNVSRIL